MAQVLVEKHTHFAAEMREHAVDVVIIEVVKTVAMQLRNTPAVCRKSYIHPRVFEAWRDGSLQRSLPSTRPSSRQLEAVALKLLRRRAR